MHILERNTLKKSNFPLLYTLFISFLSIYSSAYPQEEGREYPKSAISLAESSLPNIRKRPRQETTEDKLPAEEGAAVSSKASDKDHPKKGRHEEEEEDTEQETAEQRNTSSTEDLVCPGCFSLLEKGCVEPRIYRTTLNFDFSREGKKLETAHIDAWHESKQEELRGILKDIEKNNLNQNMALAGVSFIYKDKVTDELKPTSIYEPPFVFMSGALNDISAVKGREMRTVADYFSKLKEVPIKDVKDVLRQEMQAHLAQFFGEESTETSQLASTTIATRASEIARVYSPGFAQGYYHSEQALILYLHSNVDKWLPPLLEEVAWQSLISILNINIISDRQICRRCAATFYRLVENATGFKKSLYENLLERGFNADMNKLYLVVEVSGLRPFDNPNKSVRAQQETHLEEKLDAKRIGAHVIQKNIPETKQGEKNE